MRKGVRTVSAIVLSALLVLVLPTAARATDPLLSGYGGPGGGEQALLGSELLPPAGGGGGGSLQATSVAATAPASATSTGNRGSATDARERRDATKDHAGATSDAGATTAPPAGSPKLIPYPPRVEGASGLPLSNGDVVLALLGVAALVLMGLGLRRLAPRELTPTG